MQRVNKVEYFDLVVVGAEQLCGVAVEFSLAVRDDGRLATADDIEKRRTYHSA